ncbi:MAG: DPP IV N-terminal domain-containing protein, partial [Gammaproteobacteria bacterium]
MSPKHHALLAVTAIAILGGCVTTAQARQLTDKDYARAEQFLDYTTKPLVDHLVRTVNWLNDTRFWYVDHDKSGDHYKVMDAATGKVKPAFDQKKLAASLSAAAGTAIKANKLNIEDYKITADGRLDITLKSGNEESRAPGERYVCDLSGKGQCIPWASAFKHKPGKQIGRAAVSPNGKYAVFVRNWNLWLRNLETGKETQLTHDGVKNYGYATGNAGWVHHKGAIVRWSPDSTKVATYRQDQRKVGNMYTIQTRVGHPVLHQWKYALPGDQHVFMIEPVVIDIKTGKIVRLKMKPEERLSTLCDTLACNYAKPNTWSDVKWAPDGKTLAFVTTSRNRQHEWFRIANAETGEVHTGFHYTAKDYYESGHGMVNWQYLPGTDEAIWPTEQNNWLNLYLYSLKTGKEIRPITTGKGNVDKVLYFNRKTGTLWFVGNARTPGINPYFKQFFKVNITTGKTTLLTPEDADHTITMSPNGKYFVDSYSTPTQPPVTVLRSSTDGHIISTVARADISRLKATGWVPPQIIKVKARNGKTTLYGLMFKPTRFDPHKKYPIVDYIYPGPQT